MDRLRIVRMTLEGVKAFDRTVELGALNLFTGDVGAGKSSVLDALRFACLGFVPHLGKRESDTARIMRGARMVVRVELSDGRWFTRSLGRDHGSLRAEARASWLPPGATSTAHAGAIRGLFGDSDEEAAEHLDLRELLNATPSQRAGRIEALLSATAMTPADLSSWAHGLAVARLAKLEEGRVPEDVRMREAVIDGLVQMLDRGVGAALPEAVASVAYELKGGGLPKALEYANLAKRSAAEAVKRKTSARAEIEDRAQEAAVPADSLADLDRRRQEATDRIATVRAQLKAYADAKEARDAAERAAIDARAKVQDHDDVRRSVAQARADSVRWREQAASLAEPAEVRAPRLVETDSVRMKAVSDLESEATKIEGEAANLEGAPTPKAPRPFLVPDTKAKEELIEQRRRALEIAKADPWVRVAAIAHAIDEAYGLNLNDTALALVNELEDLAKRHGWDVEKAALAVKGAEADLETAKREARAATDANAKRQEVYDADVKVWEAGRARAAELRAEAAGKRSRARAVRDAELARVAEANAVERTRHAAETGDRAAAIDQVKRERERLLRQATQADQDADADEKAITAEEAALRTAEAHLAGIATVQPIDLSGAEAEVLELSASVESIDAAKRLVAGADARKRELDAIAAEIATAQAQASVWTALEWSLQRLRERDLAGRGGPLVERMRKFLHASGRAEEPYLRATKTATDFGWRRGGQELPVEALSGGETVLFTTALAAAVIALRKPALPVLLVEAAELGERGPALGTLEGLAAVSRDFGNVLAASCLPLAPDFDGWKILRMDRGAVAATAG